MTRASVLSNSVSNRVSRPKGAPNIANDTHYVLLPGLSELRDASGPFDVIATFEESIPDHLHTRTVVEMIRRPNLYRPNIIADGIRLIGFAALAKELGVAPAAAAIERFCPAEAA